MIIRILILAILCCLLHSCATKEEEEPKFQKVRYQEVVASSGIQPRSFFGLTKASIESKLSFRVPGIIVELPVNVGDDVNKGALIAKLDETDYLLKVQEAEAALLEAIAKERQATSDYKRMQELYESKSASKAELDAARAQSESAVATVNASDKKLEMTKLELDYATLEAPINGSIATVDVEVNENVSTGQTIVTINSRAQLEVSVDIPELLIAQVKRGEKALVSFDALPGKYYEALVTEVGVSSGVATTFPVTVRMLETLPGIRSGMAAEVVFRFRVSKAEETIYVPSQSVQGNENGERYVFVLLMGEGNEGVVQQRTVNIGPITNEGIEIISGLTPGELIVTAGVQFLNDGQTVQVLNYTEND